MSRNTEHARNLGRVDFKQQDFDKAIQQHGARVLWERSVLCTCYDQYSGQPDYTCPYCEGKGYIYIAPKEIKALAYSQQGDKEQIPIGLLDLGTSLMTTRAQDRVGFRDRITFLDMQTPYSQIINYSGDSQGEKLKYNCISMQYVHIDGVEVTDYTIEGNRLILGESTLEEFEPSNDTRIAVLMMIRPTYIVIDMPHELRGTYIKFQHAVDTWYELPKQFMIKREDLLPLTRGQLI